MRSAFRTQVLQLTYTWPILRVEEFSDQPPELGVVHHQAQLPLKVGNGWQTPIGCNVDVVWVISVTIYIRKVDVVVTV